MAEETEGYDINQVRRRAKKLYSAREYDIKYRRRNHYKPNAKQLAFHNTPEQFTEVALIAASQSGKSTAGMFTAACDLTADYPIWWQGKKFLVPPRLHRANEFQMFIVCTSAQVQRQTLQSVLLGNLDTSDGVGTGFVHLDELAGKIVMSRAGQNTADSFTVNRTVGGTGHCAWRSQEQNLSAFAGATLDEAIIDEPCPIQIYNEIRTRTTAVPGARIISTQTPTEGKTAQWRLLMEPAPSRKVIRMSLYDATQLDKAQIETIVANTPLIDRQLRIYGEPAQGSGSVYAQNPADFTFTESLESFLPQPWLKWAWAVDLTKGGSSQSWFGALLCSLDPHGDIIRIHDEIKLHGAILPAQAGAIRAHKLGYAKVVYPKDSEAPADAMTGMNFADAFKKLGLNMAPKFVTDERGVYPRLADGIQMVSVRLSTGRLKVASHLRSWFEEFTDYHMENGKAIQEHCDLMDATRVACIGVKQYRHIGDTFEAMSGMHVIPPGHSPLWGE